MGNLPHVKDYIKINLEWINDLNNVRLEALKLLKENIRKALEDIGKGRTFRIEPQLLKK
jgi:hypothetical protein